MQVENADSDADAFELPLALAAAVVEEVPLDDPPPPHALNVTAPTNTMARRG
jgi:hypothetical protein